jgi:hypothetical protein
MHIVCGIAILCPYSKELKHDANDVLKFRERLEDL